MSRRLILSQAGLVLKVFSRAGRAITLGRAGSDGVLSRAVSDGVLSRAGRGSFFSRAGFQLPSFGSAGLELPI